jgi:hypothetical protein
VAVLYMGRARLIKFGEAVSLPWAVFMDALGMFSHRLIMMV